MIDIVMKRKINRQDKGKEKSTNSWHHQLQTFMRQNLFTKIHQRVCLTQ